MNWSLTLYAISIIQSSANCLNGNKSTESVVFCLGMFSVNVFHIHFIISESDNRCSGPVWNVLLIITVWTTDVILTIWCK